MYPESTLLGNENALVVSFKPKWADKILSKEKTVELRRQFGKSINNDITVLIYASAPVSAIVGTVSLHSISTDSIDKIWAKFNKQAGVSKREFFEYFKGKDTATALVLQNPIRIKNISLSVLKERCNFRPPISWRHLKELEKVIINKNLEIQYDEK
ncbi:hypothetical protein CW749_13360 [Vibrio sp. vnigr-6D03]|uniref:hypothetical protein n=1 Tax=Vibrio sp. vnigr-6D03 TaxID=2058088 RepID=UPI000C343E84|nr:hypothetical protein [Vibrio sp. vnigr-6D03]PKF78956.1 hypothetical protein CW749_13360 [Vibrio sp. vnigr-6D03]